MCYFTLLSTSDDSDLSLANTPVLRFERQLPAVPEACYLRFAHRWHVRSVSGCSCELRHLMDPTEDFGFDEPVDWYPEDAEQIDATLGFLACVRALLSRGASVDCVDAWAHGQAEPTPLAGDLEVDLAKIGDAAFRFFENYRFSFVGT